MRTKHFVKEVRAIYFDIDEDAINIKNEILDTELFCTPTFTIQTSPEKYQLIYLLKKPLTTHFNEFEQILKFLTKYFKTDKTFDISRIFRIPNLINNKNGFNVNYKFNETSTIDFERIKEFVFLNGFKYEQDIKKAIVSKDKRKKTTTIKAHNPLKSFLYNIEQYKHTIHKENSQYD